MPNPGKEVNFWVVGKETGPETLAGARPDCRNARCVDSRSYGALYGLPAAFQAETIGIHKWQAIGSRSA